MIVFEQSTNDTYLTCHVYDEGPQKTDPDLYLLRIRPLQEVLRGKVVKK